MVRQTTKSVCVIGAGAAGLCATKHLSDAGFKVTTYEQQDQLGGTWVYSDKTEVFSSLYEKMNTNIPKEIMRFEDLAFDTRDASSFVPHQEVLRYLQTYAKPFKHLIKFNTTIVKVQRSENIWEVVSRPVDALGIENEVTHEYDAIFVCNGHFAQPRVPECSRKLKIPWIHCHNYRRPQNYSGKRVVVVGGGPSGTDIAIQVSQYADTVHLLYNQKNEFGLSSNVQTNARLADVIGDGHSLLLENGQVLDEVDAVIFCTGYTYQLPFFDSTENNNKPLVQVKGDGSYISPLYQHIVHPTYPTSMFFIGLCWSLIPFVCFDHQVHYSIALMLNLVPVPSEEEMLGFEERRIRELKANGEPINFYHRMHNGQWDYFELLSKLANRPHKIASVVRKLYDHVHVQRQANLTTYKAHRYRIIDDETFEFIPIQEQVYD